jgi:hypothetical protein
MRLVKPCIVVRQSGQKIRVSKREKVGERVIIRIRHIGMSHWGKKMDHIIAGSDPQAERRKAERKRSFSAGLLAYGGGAFVLNCLIRDIGETGAQIRMSKMQPLPMEAYLIDLRAWLGYQACRVWHRSSLAGFSFDQKFPLNETLPNNLEFLRTLFIDAQLREVERLTAQGIYLPEVLAKMSVTKATYERWLDSSLKPAARRMRTKAPEPTAYRL